MRSREGNDSGIKSNATLGLERAMRVKLRDTLQFQSTHHLLGKRVSRLCDRVTMNQRQYLSNTNVLYDSVDAY